MAECYAPLALFELTHVKYYRGVADTAKEVLEAATDAGKVNKDSVMVSTAGVTHGGTLLFKYEMGPAYGVYAVPVGSWKLKPEKQIPTEAMKVLGDLYSKIEKQTSLLSGAA